MTDISDLSNLGIQVPANWNQMSAEQQDAWADSAKASVPQTGFGPAVNDAQRDSAFQSNWNASHGGETHWDGSGWASGPATSSSDAAATTPTQSSSSGLDDLRGKWSETPSESPSPSASSPPPPSSPPPRPAPPTPPSTPATSLEDLRSRWSETPFDDSAPPPQSASDSQQSDSGIPSSPTTPVTSLEDLRGRWTERPYESGSSSAQAPASSSRGITSTPITPSTAQNSGASAGPSASGDVGGGADAGLTNSFKRALAEQPPPPATAVSIDIVLELDGMGATIPNASYGWISRNKFPARIIDVTLQNVRAESGSITIDIQTCTPGAAPTWTSICAAAIPAISGSPYYYDAVLTGWTTVLQRGQGLRAVVSGVATFTQMSVCLGARRLDLTADT